MSFDTFQTADIALGSLAYYDTGTGEPLVMLHGGEGNKGQYTQMAPLLADGVWAISYDQRDVADSFVSTAPYTMADLADDCVQLMDALGIDRAHLLGISFGGALALNVAIRHPDRVQTLIAGVAPTSADAISDVVSKMYALPHDEFIEAFARAAFSDRALEDPNTLPLVRRVVSGHQLKSDSHRAGATATHDVSSELASITAPTLLIYGSDDPLVPLSHGEQLAAGIDGSELVVIEGARHGLAAEFKERVAGLVSDFVLKHPVAG